LPSARTDPVGFGLRQAEGIRRLKVGSAVELVPYARRLVIASTIMLYPAVRVGKMGLVR
jgi:hypothetical protein